MSWKLTACVVLSLGVGLGTGPLSDRGSTIAGKVLAEEIKNELMPLRSGPAAGKEVPSFFVRAITGSQMNRSVCFVCRNGDRPVVMILLRRLESGTASVLKAIDDVVDRRRADGLRAFGVMLSDEPSLVSPHLQTVSFDEKLNMPLGVGAETLGDRDNLAVDGAASITVVGYSEKKVIWSVALRSAEVRSETTRAQRIGEIVRRVESLASSRP